MANYRSGYLDRGAPLGKTTKDVTLSADNQLVTLSNVARINLTSDNTTAANRTFTLESATLDGYELELVLVSGSSTTCQLADSGNVKLAGAWEPLQWDVLTLVWNNQASAWVETARSQATGIPDIPLASAEILVGNSSGLAAAVAVTGDIGITNGGVTSITAGAIVNADVNGSAAIAYSKLNLAASIASADLVENLLRVGSTVSLTQTNIQNLQATPIELVAAPGAGKAIVPVQIEFFHDYSTAAYTNAGGGHVVFEWGDGTDAVVLNASRVTDTSDAQVIITPSLLDVAGSGTGAGVDLTAVANQNFRITKATAEFADGDAANIVKIRVTYRVVTLLT